MQGKYQKIEVKMELENSAYNFWKKGVGNPVCNLESYKERRSVFFSAGNFLPGERYHLVLMGSVDGDLQHQTFGPLRTEGNGEIKFYKVFTGQELAAYQYCLLCAERKEGELDVIYRGQLFPEAKEDIVSLASLCKNQHCIQIFTPDKDETAAQWYRIDQVNQLPKTIERCRPWIERYGHYIIGKKDAHYYVGIPGRFLQREQPLREEGVFLLWQPIRGGEAFFDRADLMTAEEQETIFGYWIAQVAEEGRSLQTL